MSVPSAEEAVSLLKRWRGPKQHWKKKAVFASNDPENLNSFEKEDFCKEILSLNLEKDALPVHQSLGLSWDLESDSFIFNIQVVKNLVQKEASRQCLIVHDPLDFLAPLLINEKILLRKITTSVGWDLTVAGWHAWILSLQLMMETCTFSEDVLP